MISLTIPKDGDDVYVILNYAIIGPIYIDPNTALESSTFRSIHDSISEYRGMYHENTVMHHQIDADLTFEPVVFDIVPAPTTQNPDQVLWTYKTYYNTVTSTTVQCGLGHHGAVGMMLGTQISQYAYYRPSPNQLTVYQIQADSVTASQYFSRCYKWVYTFTSKTASSVAYTYDYYVKSTTSTVTTRAGDWTQKQSFDAIIAAVESNISLSSTPSGSVPLRKRNSLPAMSPQTIVEYVDTVVNAKVSRNDFTYEYIDYGDLAMEAAKKVNATNVNVIALLRDLRNPLEMIPKLKNLSKLKNIANDFLSVDFGLLPTMSDLKDILAAFQRRKPYLDRYGFSTYNAYHQDSEDKDDVHYSLEQRIKLAIADEDSTLLSIMNKIDSIGLMPTGENLWDLIPYSFVVDWFIDIGDFLERVDTRLRLLRWNVKYATMSRKSYRSTVIKPSSICPVVGTVEKVSYYRWTLGQCPTPPLSFQSNIEDLSTHWLEGGALLAQRAQI